MNNVNQNERPEIHSTIHNNNEGRFNEKLEHLNSEVHTLEKEFKLSKFIIYFYL